MSTVMSKSEFTAAMTSDNPAAMGSYQGADGTLHYTRDLISQALGLSGTAAGVDPRIAIANGIIKSLESARGAAPSAATTSVKIDTSKRTADLAGSGFSVSILAFPAASDSVAPSSS